MKIKIVEKEDRTDVTLLMKPERTFSFAKVLEDGFGGGTSENNKLEIEDLIEASYTFGKENDMLMVTKEKK